MMFLLDPPLSFVPKGITLPSFPFIQCAKRRENALLFSRKFIAVVSRKQLLLLEQNLYQLPAMMVINPKPDPPVVTILDSNPGLVVVAFSS
jgi:hypothetical protein